MIPRYTELQVLAKISLTMVYLTLQDLWQKTINLDNEKEDLYQEWAKIRAEQQQELDPFHAKTVQLNYQASALMGEDYAAADAILAQSYELELEKKALAAQHTEVNNQWAQKMAHKRNEVFRAVKTLPSQMKEAREAFLGVAEKAFSAPAAPSAATEDPVITANKGKALTAEVRKCMHAKIQLSAAHRQAEKDDLEMLATHRLAMDEFRARKAERKMALEDITLKLMDARQALKVHLSKATAAQGQAANTPTMEETDAQRAVKVEDQAKAIISAKMEPTTSSREDTPKEDWNLDLKDLKRRLLKVEALTAEANRLMTEIKAKLPESADMDIGAAEKASLAPAAPTTTSSCEDTDKHEKGLCHPKQRGSPRWSWRLRVSAGRLFRTWTSKTSKDDNLHFDISEA